jgi:predicted dehydrogenase
MNAQKPRIAVLGSGSISAYHITGLQAAGAEVAAVFSRSAGKAAALAATYGIPLALTDWQALLARADIDAVVIATPDFTHEEIASCAAAAGKPMLLQKPMARSGAECRRILAAARAAGTPLYVGFMHRYLPEIETTGQLLAEAALGRLSMVRQRNATRGANWASWFYQRALVGGGAVMQIGIHGIDLLRHLFGDIVAVQALTAITVPERRLIDGTTVRPDNEDLALASYRFASGLLATHEISYNEVAGTDRFRMEIYGEAGTAWLRTERGALAVHRGDGGWTAPALPAGDAGPRQHRHWLAMLAGAEPYDGSAEAGLASVLVAEALYRSAETGGWQTVAPMAA